MEHHHFDIGAAFLMGFVGSLHCMGMCGGIMVALTLKRSWLPGILTYNLSRVVTYSILGILLGIIGGLMTGGGSLMVAQKALSVVAGIVMVYFALQIGGWLPEVWTRFGKNIIPANLLKKAAEENSFGTWGLLGLLNGLLPCGLVYAALSMSLNSMHPLQGGLLMAAFGLGTVPALAATGFFTRALSPVLRDRLIKVAAFLLIFYGIFLAVRVFIMSGGHMHH